MSSFSQVVSAKVEQAKDAAGSIRVPGINRDRCFTLLVIDDADTDWSKYFRGRRVHGDFDVRVEQAEFRELTVSANSETGVTASIVMSKGGSKVVRSFRPDFLLVRQNLRDAAEDHRNLLLGLQYAHIPSVNSLESIYNFQVRRWMFLLIGEEFFKKKVILSFLLLQDKPWVFAQMVKAQKKLGKEEFPLIEQTFFPNQREMVNETS